MQVASVTASLTVADLERALPWYEHVLGRAPDRRPMDGLAEWDLTSQTALQVFQEPQRAGRSTVTLHVQDVDAAVRELDSVGIAHEPPMNATAVRLVVVPDPDGNRVVLTGLLAT